MKREENRWDEGNEGALLSKAWEGRGGKAKDSRGDVKGRIRGGE